MGSCPHPGRGLPQNVRGGDIWSWPPAAGYPKPSIFLLPEALSAHPRTQQPPALRGEASVKERVSEQTLWHHSVLPVSLTIP